MRIAVLLIILALLAGCGLMHDLARPRFVPRPPPTLADPPSVTQQEADKALKHRN
jgi:hypothetical protein